ncbi:MAG TPA: hypothetical protein VMX55_01320 [candidate division Zixibacteria bacterium]|nr:hypothetical protein [candidate division Zixibacteria bacterium]
MQSGNTDFSQKELDSDRICTICKNRINDNDLVQIAGNLVVHFKCYVEIQEKICSICGIPFTDQEELFFCEEHKEYFHTNEQCLKKHLKQHMPFKKVKYEATKNRFTSVDELEN